MSAQEETPEARELSLVSKLEMRIALAETDGKLQSLLNTYLAPLLLKLGSESLAVRNKTITLCQHINTRIQPASILLPVSALVKQFKEVDIALVRHFDLIYIKQGLDRMPLAERAEILPALLDGISQLEELSTAASIVFNLVLRLLSALKLPTKGSEEDATLRDRLRITPESAQYLSKWFGKLLLFSPGANDAKICPGLSESEFKFMNRDAPATETWDPSAPGGLNLVETKANAMRFLASGAFHDSERFLPAVIATADPNSRLSDVGDEILKRFQSDLENPEIVNQLFTLYFGTKEPGGVAPVRPSLRIKILALLCKSVRATAEKERIEQLIEDGLLSSEWLSGQGLQGAKLRNQIFSFVAWFAHMGSKSDLNCIAPNAIKGLIAYISSDGWPRPRDRLGHNDLELRSVAYESVGLLLPKTGESPQDDDVDFYVRTAEWLFVSLGCDDSSDQIGVSIEQTLGTLLNKLAGNMNEKLQQKLREILFRQTESKPGKTESVSGQKIVRSTLFAAVRFGNRCLPFSDPAGRWIALLASASDSPEIAEEGRKGLDPDWYRMLNPPSQTAREGVVSDQPERDLRYRLPRFTELIGFIFNKSDDQDKGCIPKVYVESYFPVYLNAIAFLRNILLSEALEFGRIDLEIGPDWGHRLDEIISTKEEARSALKRFIRQCDLEPVTIFLTAATKGAVLNHGLDPKKTLSYFVDIASLSPDALLKQVCPISAAMSVAIRMNPAIDQRMAARILGILGTHTDYATITGESPLAGFFTEKIEPTNAVSGQAVREVRGTIIAQAYWFTRMSFRRRVDEALTAKIKEYLISLLSILENSRQHELRQDALMAIGQLGLGSLLGSNTLPPDYTFAKLAQLIAGETKKGKELAIQTLGRISPGLYQSDASETVPFELLTDPLFEIYEVRDVEVQFAVGEALSVVAVGWRSKSLITEFDVDAEWPETDVPSYILASILDRVLHSCKAPKPSQKKASVIWLLSLIRYCGGEGEVQERLRVCQATFLRLLSDRDEIVQDTASRGLGLVYEMGSQNFKDELVRDLVQFFTADSSKLAGGNVAGGTELFEPGDLPTGEGSVTTYKDIVNLASEVGNPSLVYRFMSLASDKAMWTSRAAFGRFGLSNVLSDSSVSGYLAQDPKLYPKLYRYMFDPNPNVQTSMKGIWNALVRDSNEVVDTHFDAIMEELLGSIMNGKEWRVRQASCSAIANLIQSRPVEKYDNYLREILTKTFKVIDDIKGSVRSAALALGHALSSVVIRTLERGTAHAKRANLMLHHIVPFLLSQDGLESAADEVRSFSVLTLTDIIKKSPGKILSPFAPQILETFLLSLSSLESQAANYVHLNADKYGVTGQEIDKMRLSGLRSSPLMEVTEAHLLDSIDEDSMKVVAEKLQHVLRSAIGMPSRVGCSRVLVMLCTKRTLFQPYADRFLQLVKTHALDRNETVGASYSTAMGYLARLASDAQILKTIDYAKSLYFNTEEDVNRAVSAEILNSLSKYANDRVMALAAAFLPVIFIGSHDTDAQLEKDFGKAWKDNVSGPRVVSLYLNEILELISAHIESPRWAVKHACSLTVADAVGSLGNPIDSRTAELLWPHLQKAVAGRTWDGKGKVLEGFAEFAERTKPFWAEREDVRAEMAAIVLREAKRNNAQYRPHGLKCLGRYARVRNDADYLPDAAKAALQGLEQFADDSTEKMEVDSGNATSRLEEKTCIAIINCVLRCCNPAIAPTALTRQMSEATPVVEKAVVLGGKATYNELFDRSKEFFDRLQEADIQYTDELKTATLALADTLLFRDVNLPLEVTRDKRTQAVVPFIRVCWKARVVLRPLQKQRLGHWHGFTGSCGVRDTDDPAQARTIIDILRLAVAIDQEKDWPPFASAGLPGQ